MCYWLLTNFDGLKNIFVIVDPVATISTKTTNKPTTGTTSADSKENAPLNRVNETQSTPKRNHDECINGESEIIEIDDNDCATPTKSKLQKKDARSEQNKIKVSSLTNKNTPPHKENPLLKFLKSSGKKRAQNPKKEQPTCVDLTLAEEEARDAWKCEKETKESDRQSGSSSNVPSQETKGSDRQGGSSSNVPLAEEDCTEEFSLQLEDTQESEKNKVKNDEVARSPDHVNFENGIGSEKVIVEEIGTAQIANEKKDSGCGDSKRGTEETKQKAPRRVPLITLSSPKTKKKEKP